MLTDQLAGPRLRVQRLLRRRRRPLAAALAAAAVLLAVTSLRAPDAAEVDPSEATGTYAILQPGEVSVPISLGSPAITSVLSAGQVVDIVGVSDDGRAEVVASEARIIGTPQPGSTLSGASSSVVMIAVREAQALPLLAAAAEGSLSVIIRQAATPARFSK